MNKIPEKINTWNNRKIGAADWVMLAVMAVFIFFMTFYGDLIVICEHSLTFLDSLFHGDIANFYTNSLNNPSYGFGAVYYWTPYAVEGIWCLPVYILSKLTTVNTQSLKCCLWYKLGIALALLAATAMLTSILRELKLSKEKIRFAQFFFLSSLLVILPVVAVAQFDIITVFLLLWGIREYIRTDRITWKFLLIFSFAASLKSFALFVFLPLVFLKEKRILAAVWDVFVGLWGILLCVVPYAWRADYKEATAILNDVMKERLFAVTLQAGQVDIPVFWALLVALCIFAYTKSAKGAWERLEYAAWLALAVFAAFFTFVFSHPYWIVLLAPFFAVIITINDGSRKLNMILETLVSVSCMFVYLGQFGVFMTEGNMKLMLLEKLGLHPNGTGYTESAVLFEQTGLSAYIPQVFAVFAVCLAAFLVINRPAHRRNTAASGADAQSGAFVFDHGMIYLRLALILAYIVLHLYIAYIN